MARLFELYKSVPRLYHYQAYLTAGLVISLNLLLIFVLLARSKYYPLALLGVLLGFGIAYLRRESQSEMRTYTKFLIISILNCLVSFFILVFL